MERVIGIGGIFFKANDPAKLAAWYREHLGVELASFGGAVFGPTGDTVWSPFPQDTTYFGSDRPFMINYRVASLDRMLAQLRAAGVSVDEKVDRSEFGNFGWAIDPEGNRFELWEPPAK
jgi:catechol 2,3-dioxygenase-like lactoylglutathione lyase family enzyme